MDRIRNTTVVGADCELELFPHIFEYKFWKQWDCKVPGRPSRIYLVAVLAPVSPDLLALIADSDSCALQLAYSWLTARGKTQIDNVEDELVLI